MKNFFLLLFFSAFLFYQFIFSQEKIIEKTDVHGLYKLSDVVVSATKTQTSTLELANSITVIDSEEIASRNAATVFDLLKNECGISFFTQGGPGSLSNVSIRGGSADYTLVLVDGIEVNLNSDPKNVYDFAFLSTDNIQSVEILRGPQSTLYGSNSLAGVINVITKKGIGKPNFSIQSEAGSYKTFKNILGLNGSVSDFNYSLTFSRAESEGFSAASEKYGNVEKDGYKKDLISARFGYDFGDNAQLNFFVNYNSSNSDYDQSGGKFGDDPTYVFNQEEYSFRGEGNFNLFDQKWKQKIGISHIRNIRKYSFDYSEFNSASSHSSYDGYKLKIDWQNNLSLIENHLLTFGIDNITDNTVSEYYYNSPFFSYVSLFPKKKSNILGAYLQDQFKVGQNFFAAAGIRLDTHDKFGSAFTFRVAPAYIIWETGTKIKATIGSGFKAPSLFNLYDQMYGNPSLKPEKSLGFDFGIEQFLTNDLVSIGVTYFQNNFRDLFGYDQLGKPFNINKAKTNGVETNITSKFIKHLIIKMNYAFTNAKDESEGISDENRKLVRRPEHKVGGYVSYNFSDRFNSNIEVVYVGEREDLVFDNVTFASTRISLDPYILLNFNAHLDLFAFLRLNLRLENILDTEYEEVYGYAASGFAVYGGIKLSLNDL
ncbi:MAG: TonB-dependent receptor [Ignavibacteriaceae bacterium]|nr:TonB-dependent receptor [Ignavibacteriaceae bacterium]